MKEEKNMSTTKYLGITTTALTGDATTNPIKINNMDVTAKSGDIVSYSTQKFIFDGAVWKLFEKITKVLWFSKHLMTGDQHQALVDKLGECEVRQIKKTICSEFEIRGYCREADVIAVTPLTFQAQFLMFAGEKPVIMEWSKRAVTPSPDGGEEDDLSLVFDRWKIIKKINLVMEDF